MPSTKEDVQAVLAPYHERIASVIARAWSEWRVISAFRAEHSYDPVIYSRTVANHVFDAIARIAIREFAEDFSVNVKVEAQTVKFFFNGSVLARFKKGDGNKLGQNNPTQAVLDFVTQDCILPGMPPETAKVEFVWIPNSILTAIDRILVVARDGNRLLWDYEITQSTGAVLPFPAGAVDSDDLDTEGLVRPRLPAGKSEEQG